MRNVQTIPYYVSEAKGSGQANEWMRLGRAAQIDAAGIAKKEDRENKLGQAINWYAEALRADPKHARCLSNMAVVFAQMEKPLDALMLLEVAEMEDPKLWSVHVNKSILLFNIGRSEEALAEAKIALEMEKNPTNMFNVASILGEVGRVKEALPLYEEVLKKEPRNEQVINGVCFAQTLADVKPADMLKARTRCYEFYKKYAVGLGKDYKPKHHPNSLDLDQKCRACKGEDKDCKVCNGAGIKPMRSLRVGYVGGDFRGHSAPRIFKRVVLEHTSAIEVYLYSTQPSDPTTDPQAKAFRDKVTIRPEKEHDPDRDDDDEEEEGFDEPDDSNAIVHWRDIFKEGGGMLPLKEVDEMIRRDRIDILVDLAAHTAGGLLPLFIRKPAPIQVTAWGFAHGTGVVEIDYFLADKVTVKEDEREYYVEKVWDLPCTVTFDPPKELELEGESEPPYKDNGFVTFGCFARYNKMSNECLDTFSKIMKQVPGSRIIFKDMAYAQIYARKRVKQHLDIEDDRIIFALHTNSQDHLLYFQKADIVLDPFPHGGGTVCLEQLYMGVPMVTRYGPHCGCRTASSVLTLMGHEDWIAYSEEEYVEKAVWMAENAEEIGKHRKNLRRELLESPVYVGYVEAVEAAYKAMWKRYCEER